VTRLESNIRIAGFTLVELMIVVLIAAILLAIAVPTYQTQIRKSRRTDAKTAVLDLAAREEKYLSLNNTYTSSPAYLGYAAASSTATSFSNISVGSNYYYIYACAGAGPVTPAQCPTTSSATGTTYVVAAIPIAGTPQAKDVSCQYFAVDNTGAQYSSDSTSGSGANTTSTCWQ
jgi:type IV pilus assembly protein PilE